ncbi:hypothetical protein LRS10_13120 [Phenylobacterium sp. J426]|nr:hypothetical protein [Phenylobacterium sp. J426]MCR5875038.1 hypothetical protein [Phenylobacterium sp. J426]
MDYRRNAQECRKLAARMPPAHKQQLLEMARQWEAMAEEEARGAANDER